MAMQMNRVNRKVLALLVVPGCSRVSVAASSHIFRIPDMDCIDSVSWVYSNTSGGRLDSAPFTQNSIEFLVRRRASFRLF